MVIYTFAFLVAGMREWGEGKAIKEIQPFKEFEKLSTNVVPWHQKWMDCMELGGDNQLPMVIFAVLLVRAINWLKEKPLLWILLCSCWPALEQTEEEKDKLNLTTK